MKPPKDTDPYEDPGKLDSDPYEDPGDPEGGGPDSYGGTP